MELASTYIALFLCLIASMFFVNVRKRAADSNRPVPPGSLGIPIIGQSFEFFRAMRANKAEEWLQERIRKYGPISKFHLYGSPTVFLHGQAANKFVYTCDDKILSNHLPGPVRKIFGERNISELSGDDHKRIRGALLSFLKPEALRQSVGTMDGEVRIHLENHWHGRDEIQVMPLMKILTFDIICSLIFGIERGPKRDTLVHNLEFVMEGALSLPISLPFTRFTRALHARSKVRDIVMELIRVKRAKLECTSGDDVREEHNHQDLITCWLMMRDDETNLPLVSDEEIVDNCIVIMMAGYDTTAILLSFLIKVLAENPDVHRNIVKEHEEIRRGKASDADVLVLEDLAKMKYTWRVATESLRMNPPVFCSIRKVAKDIEIGGYLIPKGWQVMWAGFMTHMDKSIFADPHKFLPSRFESQGGVPAYCFIPFGGGPRMCPGYEFARIETLTMIHYLVTGFEWKLSLKENLFGRNPVPLFYSGLPIQVVEIKKPAPSGDVV